MKKVFALAFGLLMAAGATAQYGGGGNYPYPADSIEFWTGTGSNEAIVVISWDDEDASYAARGFAWGVRFNGSITAHNLLDTIAAYDSRFTFAFSGSLLSTIEYNDPANGVHLTPSVQYNCFNMNGTFAPDVYDNIYVTDEDMMEISESCYFDCTNVTPATNPNGTVDEDPVDATIAMSDILYWVGEGSNQAAFVVSFAQPDTALAWGYRYNAGATIQNMIDDIATADPRLTVVGNPSMGGDILFVVAEGDTLKLSPVDPEIGYNFWWTNLNGMSVASLTTALQDGDVFKYGDYNSATGWDFQFGYYMQEAWTTPVHPVSVPGTTEPQPEEATIAASDILYWVGTGANQVVMAVNWADTALAWGYRFDGSKTVADMMEDIAAADSRFSYTMSGAWLDDILFVAAAGDTLRKQPYSYWESKNNGMMDAGMGQTLVNGDFEKWADPAAGVVVDSTYDENYDYWYYTYVYPMEVHPVSVPVGIAEVNSVNVCLYPNPAAVVLNVTFDALENNGEVELFDMSGRRVMTSPAAAGSTSVQMPVSQLSEGVYMLRVAGATAKVVVSR